MKKNWIIAISTLIAGLLLLIFPRFCVRIVVVLLGLTAVLEGFYGIITERTLFENEFFQKTTLLKSIGNIIIGILAIVMPLALAGTAWTVMTYVLAIYLLISGCAGFFASSKLKTLDSDVAVERKQLTLENALTLAAGILLFIIGPEKLGMAVIRIIGALALTGGVIAVLVIVLQKNKEVKADNIVIKDDEPEVSSENSDSQE